MASLGVGLSRAVSSDIVLLEHRRPQELALAPLFRCLLVSAFVTASCAAVAVVAFQWTHIWLLLGIPALFLQDFARFTYIATGRTHLSLIVDVLCLAALTVSGLTLQDHVASPAGWIALWSLAAFAGVTIALADGLRPSMKPSATKGPIIDARSIKLGADYSIGALTLQIPLWTIASTVGPVGVAALRGADLLLGPLRVLGTAVYASVLRSGRVASGLRAHFAIVGPLQAVTVVWGVVLMTLPGLGMLLLDSAWPVVRPIVPIVLTGFCAVLVTQVQSAHLKILRRERDLIWLRLGVAGTSLVLSVGGALVGGVIGAALGATITSILAAAAWSFATQKTLEG